MITKTGSRRITKNDRYSLIGLALHISIAFSFRLVYHDPLYSSYVVKYLFMKNVVLYFKR